MPEVKESAAKKSMKEDRSLQMKHAFNLSRKWLKENALDARNQDVKSALTAEDAKRLLGWKEVENEHHFIDCEGRKICCLNNRNNRAFRESDARCVAQDILNLNYAFNAESIVIGTEGNVLSGQHRLIGLVFAEQLRSGPQSAHWSCYWPNPVVVESIVVYNVDESLRVTRTIDNTRPRTVSDALYVDPELSRYNPKDRKYLARLIDAAIRVVWRRTGHADILFRSKRTNAEMLSFKDRHPRILLAVKHVHEEDGMERRVSGPGRWLPAGVAAGLLYLMGCSRSDGDAYRVPKPNKNGLIERVEKGLDWSLWEKACEFWVMLAANVKDDEFLKNARKTRRPVDDPSDKYQGYLYHDGSTAERVAAICKAWQVFVSGEKPTPGLFRLNYAKSELTGLPILLEDPVVGGIDLGQKGMFSISPVPIQKEETSGKRDREPSFEEIREQAKAIRAENARARGIEDTGNLD